MFNSNNFLILLVLLFVFFLKIQNLSNNPAGFFADEASVGYDAYMLLTTGADRNRDKLPLFFKGFNYDNVSPFHVYLTVPFIAIWGLNEFAVRFTPVFWSTLEILFFYLLLKEIINDKFALLGALLLGISPWHFHLSRINMGDFYSWTMLTTLAYLTFIKLIKSNNKIMLAASAIFFALACYSYTPARMLGPLLIVISYLILLIKKGFKLSSCFLIICILVLIPFIYFHLTNSYSLQRLKDTMGVDIKNDKFTNVMKKNTIIIIYKKYINHFSDDFLFNKGDTDFPGQFIRRHSIAGMGLLHPYQKIFILIGVIWLLFYIVFKKRYELLLVVVLLLVFPVPDSLTNDNTPYATRSYLGIIPFHMLIIFGIYALYELLVKIKPQKKIIKFSFLISLSIIVALSVNQLINNFNKNPLSTSDFWGWQYGSRDIVAYFSEHEKSYDDLIMIPAFNAPGIFFKFYAPNGCVKCKIGVPDNFYVSGKRQLFAVTPAYMASHPDYIYKPVKTIYYPNGNAAFILSEIAK